MKYTSQFLNGLADRLELHNRWRRGNGEFKWTGDSATEKPMPFTAEQVGKDIDRAVKALRAIAKDGGVR